MKWAGHVTRTGEVRNAYKILVENSEGKIRLGGPARRWEDNIEMDLKGTGYEGVD
jgi:hypothetical protein